MSSLTREFSKAFRSLLGSAASTSYSKSFIAQPLHALPPAVQIALQKTGFKATPSGRQVSFTIEGEDDSPL